MQDRKITLPLNPAADWTSFAWPSKDPRDTLPYVLDATAWLTDAGLTLVGVLSSASVGLILGPAAITSAGLVTIEISGGTPSTTAQVDLALTLSSGNTLYVTVALPIRAAVPGGLVPTGLNAGAPLLAIIL